MMKAMTFALVFLSASLWAANPTAPPIEKSETRVKSFGCKRTFSVDGEVFDVDSPYRQDAEKLRPYYATVPSALSELEIYQKNRRSAQVAVYTTTAGVLIALGGIVVGNSVTNPQSGQLIRNIGLITGGAIAAGSLFYGFGILQTNERHLKRGADEYNKANPNRPIELQFNTGIFF